MRYRSIAALVAVATSLLGPGLSARSTDKTIDSNAILERVRTLEDVKSEGSGPFVLRARLQWTDGKSKVEGAYSLTWLERNRWHEELQLGQFSRVRDGSDGGYWETRSWDYEPRAIFDLDQLLGVAALAKLGPKESARKVHGRKIAGADLSCVEIRFKDLRRRELCVDPATGLLVHAEVPDVGIPEASLDYADPFIAGEKRFPSRMTLQRAGESAAGVTVESMGVPSGGTSLPAADPSRSEFWETCEDAIPPELAKFGHPVYPQASKARHESGNVTLYARIEADGTVDHLKVLSAPSPDLGNAASIAVAAWKYKPRMCGDTPQRTEMAITILFTIGP